MKINPLALALNLLPMVIGKPQSQAQSSGTFPDSQKRLGYNLKDRALLSVKRKDGSVTVILGTRETGKSNLGYRLAEFFGRPTYAISPEERPPKWVTRRSLSEIVDIVSIPPYSTLLVDDMPVVAGNRSYNDELVQKLEKIIPMVRHERKLHLIFLSQSASQSDRYILDCDLALLKPLGILSGAMERPSIWRIYRTKVNPEFEGRNDMWVKTHVYMMSRGYEGILSIGKVK